MKKFIAIAILLTMVACNTSKHAGNNEKTPKSNSQKKYPRVRVTDWGKSCMMLGDEVWANGQGEIVAQIGQQELDSVKKKFDYRSVPPKMSLIYYLNQPKGKKVEALAEKMNQLKVLEKIASFRNFANGKEWDRLCILRIPYKGNESFDVESKWDTVYVVVPEVCTEIIQ